MTPQITVEKSRMKAIRSTQYGGPDVLQVGEFDIPTPKEHEILVKVYAASITAADSMIRRAEPFYGRLFLGLTKPKQEIPGTGFAGKVVAVGEQVTQFELGDRVFGETGIQFGAHAEYICLSAEGVVAKIPANMTYDEAAPICDGALTSLNFLKNLGEIEAGQKVLINGASGSLGTAAVQLARYFGAEVTGVCSSRNIDMVKSLGAHHVIDYTATDFTKSTKTYDIIYDTVGTLSYTQCKSTLTPKGSYICPVLKFPLLMQMLWTSRVGTQKAKFSATGMMPAPELRKLLKELTQIIESGKLETHIDRCYFMEEIADAHRYVDSGRKKGNVIMTFPE